MKLYYTISVSFLLSISGISQTTEPTVRSNNISKEVTPKNQFTTKSEAKSPTTREEYKLRIEELEKDSTVNEVLINKMKARLEELEN